MNLTDARRLTRPRKRRRRVGRGRGSGAGKTAGRGHKGAHSRSGSGGHLLYEGGQMPLFRRSPKRGFSNDRFRRRAAVVNVADLKRFPAGSTVGPEELLKAKLVGDGGLVKLLGRGDLDRSLTVRVHLASRTAQEKIASAGGRLELVAPGSGK